MPQQPTGGSPRDAIGKFGGLNDQQDSVKRPQGSVTDSRNIIDHEQDCARRPGRDLVSVETGAISTVFQLTWDDGMVMPIQQSGTAMAYDTPSYPTLGNVSTQQTNPGTPGPMPTEPNFLPLFRNGSGEIPDYASLFRALSEARQYANGGVDDITFPSLVWYVDFYDSDKTLVQTGVQDKDTILRLLGEGYKPARKKATIVVTPSPGTDIQNDFYFVDYFCDPQRILLDLDGITSVRTIYNSVKNSFVKTDVVEGSATVSNYTGADDVAAFPLLKQPSPLALEGRARLLASLINALLRVKVTGSQANTASKITADDFTEPTCDLAKTHALSYWSVLTWDSATPYPIQSGDKTQTVGTDYASQIFRVRGKLAADLSSYSSGSASIFLLVAPPTNLVAGQSPPVVCDSTYHEYTTAMPGSVYTSDLINNIDAAPAWTLACPLAAPFGSGWQINSVLAILTRQPSYIASIGGGSNVTVISPSEYFLASAQQTVTTATAIVWGSVKRSPSDGGADPSYPLPTALGGAVAITPTDSVKYSSDSGGFNKSRFPFYYRPCILLAFKLQSSNSTTGATTTARLYVNSTLAATVSGIPAVGGTVRWAFSIKDIGDYGTSRPPQNDASNGYAGWASPSVKVTVQPSSGTLVVSPNTKLEDYVMAYPAS